LIHRVQKFIPQRGKSTESARLHRSGYITDNGSQV